MPELEYISLQEVRENLAGFFKAVNSGRSFAVFQKGAQLALVGRIKATSRSAIAKQQHDPATTLDELLEIISKAHLEAKRQEDVKHL